MSLGGASKKEEKASLLHRTQEERRKREEERRRLKNAIIIQSFIRGYRDRRQQYSIQRSSFDRCANLSQSGGTFSLANGPNLTLLVRQLLFFYKQNEDSKRLVSVNSIFTYPCLQIFQPFFKCDQITPLICVAFVHFSSASYNRSSLW